MSSGLPTQPAAADSTVCFADRLDAGARLAPRVLQELEAAKLTQTVIVYALPRGGLAVAVPVAQALRCPLDVIVAKKITRPENPELAIGAVTADGYSLWLPRSRSPKEPTYLNEIALHKARERAYSQQQQFEASRPPVNPTGAIALIVDDGIATGMTMAVAVQALRAQNPAQIWLCVPVAPPEIMPHLQQWAERVIVLATPSPFLSVSRFYREFKQIEMEAAIAYLQTTNQTHRTKPEA